MASTKLFEEFPPVSTEKWEQVIQKDLKGADYAKKLLWQTEEGITVEPYYRAEDIEGLPHLDSAPGEFPFVRGNAPSNDWKIRELVTQADPAAANALARQALEAGAEEIEFAAPNVCCPSGIAKLTAGLDGVPVHLDGSGELYAAAVASGLAQGSLANDPIANPDRTAEWIRAAKPGLKVATISGYKFGDAGATVVQELAYSLAAGIEYLSDMTERGIPAAQANASLAYTLSVGSNYFFEIAKLRAARLLAARILESFGLLRTDAKSMFYARTSWWDKTVYDPYVNLLRTTTEAMSAALGGADALTVLPFDSTYHQPDEFSRHLARNIQILLKAEVWLDRVADPAGGSWYVESLTQSIAQAAWSLIQVVEAAGGFRKAQAEIDGAIARSREAKEAAVASRRRALLGTNQYPNLNERMLPSLDQPVEGPRRGAQVFEDLRLKMERSGEAPLFLLTEIGDLKMRKARSGFITNFFGCAGFRIQTEHYDNTEALIEGVRQLQPAAVVLCSSDTEYSTIAPAVVAALGGKTPVLVAGFPKETLEALKAAGVADFIHVRTNAAEALALWQQKLGVKG